MTVGIYALVYGRTGQRIDRWLQSFDPAGHGGDGLVQFTPLVSEAQRFDSARAALRYMLTPGAKPVRSDGKPNRPLRGFECEIRSLPDD